MEWKKFSEHKPIENGWYLVTVDYTNEEDIIKKDEKIYKKDTFD